MGTTEAPGSIDDGTSSSSPSQLSRLSSHWSVELARAVGSTLMGCYALREVSGLLRDKVFESQTWGIALLALLVLPADLGVKLLRRVIGASGK